MSSIPTRGRFLPRPDGISIDAKVAPVVSASFFDASFVSRVSRESAAAAVDVIARAEQADPRAIDIAALEVTTYSSTAATVSGALGGAFFSENMAQSPVTRRDTGVRTTLKIDEIEVGWSGGSSVDSSMTIVRASVLEADLKEIGTFHLFRADLGPDVSAVPLTLAGIQHIATRSGRKSDENLASIERVLRERDQAGGLSQIQRDPILNMRRVENSGTIRVSRDQNDVQSKISIRNLKGLLDPSIAAKIDPVVSLDTKVLSRIARTAAPDAVFTVAKTFVSDDIQMTQEAKSDVFRKSSEVTFRSIASCRVSSLPLKRVADGIVEFSITDQSVVRGSRYIYYIIPFDSQSRPGKRTDAVSVSVDLVVSPPPPTVTVSTDGRSVSLHIVGGVGMESFEIHRRVDRPDATWAYMSAVPASSDGGASWCDRAVVPGRAYHYRVYSIDRFRNKSQLYGGSGITVTNRQNPIVAAKIAVNADVDQLLKKVVVNISVDSPSITALFITRRDRTVGSHAFRIPQDADIPGFGSGGGHRSLDRGAIASDQRSAWNGFISVAGPGDYVFVDNLSRLDHAYQYSVYAVDNRGAKSIPVKTNTVFFSNRPIVDSPRNLRAEVTDTGVALSWKESNITISPSDMLGDREELAATSVRNLYQLQRKSFDSARWDDFSLLDSSSYVDQFGTGSRSTGPEHPVVGSTYLYRVATYQTGGYYSNFTQPVTVSLHRPPSPVGELTVRCSDTRVSPVTVVVNWNGSVDGVWRIERAAVNNISAPKFSTVESVSKLEFKKVADVTPESSRGNPKDVDAVRKRNTFLFTGQRFYIDSDITAGNTYFYRVTAVSAGGSSNPSYGGVAVNSPSFDRKLDGLLSVEEKSTLSSSPIPLTVRKRR